MAQESRSDFVLFEDNYMGNFPNFPAFNRLTTAKYGDCGYGYPTQEILRNERLTREAGCDNFYKIRAQHGAKVLVVSPLTHNYCRCDGLIAFNNGDNPALIANTGDCPILFLTDEGRNFIGLIHCGWHPLKKNIIGETYDILALAGIDPARIMAAIWPGICAGCYEVGWEFNAYFPGKVSKNGRLDLAEIIHDQLEAAGTDNIIMAEPTKFCSAHTFSDGDFLFHSHRREKNGCRNAAVIAF